MSDKRPTSSIALSCIRCHTEHYWGTLGSCLDCGGVLQPVYPDARVRQLAAIEPGPGTYRFRSLLPAESEPPYLGEGNTPLLPSRAIGPGLGLSRVYFKQEGQNPSGAFKDRVAPLVAALALDAGATGVITASSGNASAAISAYCAAAALKCVVLLEPGNPPAKLRQTIATGAQVIPVDGIFSRGPHAIRDLVLAVSSLTDLYPAFVWAPVNPYILEGIKTISYEIVYQLSGAPDVVISPAGGGDLLTAQWRGYRELRLAGVIQRLPRMIAVQSLSAAPLLEAFRGSKATVPILSSASSKISGINVPFSGDHALAAVYDSAGSVVGVEDDQIFAIQRRMAEEEGIWVEPAGAAAVTALEALRDQGEISDENSVVCILSGAGFKDTTLAADAAHVIGDQSAVPFDAAAIAELSYL